MTGVFHDTPSRQFAGGAACIWTRESASLLFRCALFAAAVLISCGVSHGQDPSNSEPQYFPADDSRDPLASSLAPHRPMSGISLETEAGDVTSEVPADGEVLADVRIEGNETIPTSAIARYVKTRLGRPVSQQQIRDDRTALYGTRWFYHVEIKYRRSEQGWVLVFKVLERPIVKKVEFRGNKKISTKKLQAEVPLKADHSAFDASVNREAARRIEQLYHEKGYRNATVELEKGGLPDDREVIFVINEGVKVRVTHVGFSGNSFVSGELLRTKIRTSRAILWVYGGKYDPETVPDDISAIKQYYRGLGFFDVNVEPQVSYSDDGSRVSIDYSINEGRRFRIREKEYAGNRIFSDKELASETKLEAGEFFNAHTLSKDLTKLRAKYGETGRLFANVQAVPRFLDDPGVIDLVYQIDEDRVNYVRKVNVHIEGDRPHTKKTVVHNYMRIHPGDIADPRLIKLSESRLEGSQLFERGPMAGVRLEVTPVAADGNFLAEQDLRGQNADSDNSTLPQNVIPKPFSAARPNPRGAPPRAAPQSDGPLGFDTSYTPLFFREPQLPDFGTDPFQAAFHVTPDPGPIIRGQNPQDPFLGPQNPLYESSPQGDPLSPPPGLVDIDVFAPEARTGRLMFGVGVNSDAGVVGSIILSEQNFDLFNPPTSWRDVVDGNAFRGAGQRFRLEAVPGTNVSRYLINWSDPYIFDSPYNLSVSGFYYNRFFRDWTERRGGGRVALGRQLTPEWSANVALRAEDVVISNPDVPTPPILAEAVGSNFLSTVRASITYDTRDAAFLPSEGHIVEAAYEQAFGEFTYPRAELDARQFFTLYSRPDGGGKHILTFGGNLGWTGDDTPIFERFFGGGFQSFRGFEFRGVTPRVGGVRVGGQWMAIGTAEYLFPLMANEMVHGVVFTDFGTVENDVGFDDFRVTAGAGLRLTVPAMGPVPLAFDFGIPIVKQNFDDEQIFSFYVGFTR